MPVISIIVPVYNSEKDLNLCIDSILSQDFKDFELLLIDDGSKDRSADICDNYAKRDNRIRCFHIANGGVGNARNYGIEKANGSWICFIDSDDIVLPSYLSAFDTLHTDADIVISGIEFLNVNNGQTIRKEQYKNSTIDMCVGNELILSLLLIGYPYSKVYRHNFLKDNALRFPTDISFHEDHVFVLDCYLKANKIEMKSDVTYIYRIDYSHQSLSKKRHPWQKHWMASQYMFEKLSMIRDAYSLNNNLFRNAYTFTYESIISAVYDLYDSEKSYHKRIDTIRMLLKGSLPIKQLYFPNILKGKLIKNIVIFFPLCVVDLFFRIVNMYQNRNR